MLCTESDSSKRIFYTLRFQVSKEVWKMLLRKHGELKHSKVHIYERTSSGKSDGRYMPYPKVDSFLKICQILGLTGIDLFSPSDVVEKRDIRRVCMCIRSLSKKARSKKLNVPYFDIVTHNIAMPTHLVGSIRRNLELSWCSPSSFSASSPWNDAREICRLKIPYGHHSQHSASRSVESESNFSDIEFESPFLSASYDATNVKYIVGETSPGLSPTTDDFVHETSCSNSIESNHFEVVCYCHLSKTQTCMFQNLSSSSYSEHPTDQNTSICFVDIGKGAPDSIHKDVKNGLKAEHVAGTLDVEAYMNVSSLNVGSSEDNQQSQSSSPTFSHLEVHSVVEVEPCNTRQKSSVFENAIATYNMAMKNRFYYMETSDDFKSVTPKSYSLDTAVAGNDGNSPSEIKSPSILDVSSTDNYSFDSELEGSSCTLASKNAYSFFSSLVDEQNKFSRSLIDPPERNQNELAHTSLCSIENDFARLSQFNDPNSMEKRNCGSQSTNPLISSFIESEFECSSSSSVCLTCSDVNIEEASYLVTDSYMQENDVHKENFKTDLNKPSINSLVPVVQEDVDIAAHSLSLEEGKFCNDASYKSFQGQFMSSRLNSGIEVGSNVLNDKQVDASYQSCQTQENSEMFVEGNFSKEPCERYNFHMPKSEGKNKMSKCALELIENHGSSSNYTQDKDHGCICGSMVDGSSISGLQRMVSTIPERQKSPEKEDSVEHTDVSFYDGIFSSDDSDRSDELKMHQSSHDASGIVFLLSDYESKIPTSKKGPEMTVVDKKSSVNPENCQYDDGKMRDFGHQMKKLNSFCAKDFEVLDVMETLGESFQTVHIPPSSTSDCREQKEVASDGSIEVEKHVVSYIHNTYAEPNNAPQAKLDHSMFQKDIKLHECGKSKSREGRTVGKTGNQVLKSVAGVMTMVGAFVLLLHVRQKNDKEEKNETWMPFQIQKPNREFFTTRKIKIGKSDSLYPAEKLKF
ncbi:protein OPAQUE10 isoform X2 [Dendrobium catenatum]|uniref:protein OPAQUE10 isoform X2 n=1 Tax=Dendrobium catenatum TaxID=906689 RepID=UPI0009F72631|nr:protein OPAQUE10 isoform X2 [Dendrobium catenatum]